MAEEHQIPAEDGKLWKKPESLIAWVAFELSLLLYMSEDAGTLYQLLYPRGNGKSTVGLAGKLLFGDDYCLQNPESLKRSFDAIGCLFQVARPTKNLLTEPLVIDDRLISYLGGVKELSLPGMPFISIYQDDCKESREETFRADELDRVSRELETFSLLGPVDRVPVVAAIGEEMSGRKFLLKRIADERNYELLMVPFHAFGDMEHLLYNLQKFLREILLSNQVLCIVDVKTDEHTMTMLQIILREYEETAKRGFYMGAGDSLNRKPLFLTGDGKMKLSAHFDRFVCQVECKTPDMAQAAAAWDCFALKYLGDRVLHSRELAIKMKLPYGKIEQIVKKLRYAPVENPYDSKYIFRCCYELLDDGRYDNIKRVEAKYTIDDLKLEETQKSIIRDICNQVEYRRKVMDDWNLKSRYSYGTCVSALFTGPPGTGKTMAVHVMAGILGLELYKVDVSQLVDKYIGETEKWLEEVFQRAEKSNSDDSAAVF